ncbi:TonB-dependent receptor [Henriciella litoralis]|uniref:TonB-dependent receptor n=1 Tax=Henriciella litoralis TaxID=568102 RepID=UPI000A005554|nr:TonB-dependent receptor [Henriciella litoralis]
MPFCRLFATTSSLVLLAQIPTGLATGQEVEGQGNDVIVADSRLPIVEVYGDRRSDQPGSVATLDAETIAEIDADHPAEILNELPGVNIQMNSGQEHLIALRSPVLTGGAGQGSFLILENGVPTRAPAFGNVNSLFEIHHEVAEAIEIVRGPASAKYGSNAVHGLINVILGEPAPGTYLDTRLSGSTLNRYRADLTSNVANTARISLSVQDDAGWRDNTGVEQQKLSGSYAFDFAGWDGLAWVTATNLNQETAGFLEGYKAYREDDIATTNPNPEAYRDAKWAMGAVRLSRPLGDGTLTLTPFYRWQEMEFAQHFLPNGGFEQNGQDGGGVMARYEQSFDAVTMRVGADLDISSGWLKETQPDPFGFFPGDSRFPTGVHYDYTVDTTMLALWGEAEWEVSEDLTILAGLRGETHEYDYSTDVAPGPNGRFLVPADREDSFDLLTPKLGAIWTPGNGAISYYANYARGERAPQASDLYRLQSQQGIAEADVETMDSIEVGMRGTSMNGALYFDLAAYYAEKDNFFFRDSDGLNVTDGSTRHQGLEANLAYAISDQFSVSATGSLAEHTYTFDRIVGNGSEIIRSGNEVDTAPNVLGDLTLNWTPTERFEASLSAEYIGEYFTDPANEQTYPGHTLTNVRLSYDFSDDLEAYVIVRNLFDLNYADRADYAFGNDRYFPGEPLNATFGVRKRFN